MKKENLEVAQDSFKEYKVWYQRSNYSWWKRDYKDLSKKEEEEENPWIHHRRTVCVFSEG